MATSRLLRTSWDDASWLFPPRGSELRLALSYGSFFITKTYGSPLSGDSYRVGGTVTHFPGRELPVMPPNLRPSRKLDIAAVEECLDTALRVAPLRCTLLADRVHSFFLQMDAEVVQPYMETYRRNRSTRRSRWATVKLLEEVRETFEDSMPFSEAGAPPLDSAWMPPPPSGWRHRLA